MRKNKGFSLLELLVVISIIGILITLGLASFSTAQKKSRDARRKSDIKAIQNGFEQYYAMNGSYGASCVAVWSDAEIFPGNAPVDPKNSASYSCAITGFGTGYCVCAEMETGIGNSDATNCGTLNLTNGANYCLKNLQ